MVDVVIGTFIGNFRVSARLGVGGMGEVYRARDTRLGREVAIKVLPASISQHPESIVRFEREAKALAALNHPHIAAIYGFDADNGRHFLVLELVEGDTLSERLRHGRLPVEEALRVARQMAEAVESAHAKGIIHRDLKPGNIKITPDGRVKVLDFGLAKMEQSLRSGGGAAHPQLGHEDAATLPAETTRPGAVMGTPAYMSPEQARGQEVDKRTDVWAFGCCLFESLSGSKPFRGETVTDLMAEVLRSEPNWSELPEETPHEVTTLLRRCLEKDPRRRLRDLGDIALLLEDSTPARGILTPRTEVIPPKRAVEAKGLRTQSGIALGIAGVVIGLLIAGIALWRQPKSAAHASQIRTLAVLPFEVNTADPKLAGLDKWIPVEIVSKLGQVTNLQIVNLPAKIEQLASQKKSEDEIARELKVDALVRGQLHGQGEAITVYVSVVDGATGHTVGETRKLSASVARISEIPNQVALAVVEELKLQISATQRSGLQEPETKNSEAFLAYQRGRDLTSSRKFAEGAVELRRAYQLDPNYTRAWTRLAGAEWIPLIYGGTINELRSTFQRLTNEAEKFRAQRPDDPAIASLRMWIAMIFERDWKKVRTIYWENQRHGPPDPDLAQVMMYYYAFIEGHPEQAAQVGDLSIELVPEDLICRVNYAWHLFHLGRFEDALRAFRQLEPEKTQLEDYSRQLVAVGDLAGAKQVAERVFQLRPTAHTQAGLALIHAKLGALEEARKLLRELESQAEHGKHIPYTQIAAAYGALGDFENARHWLRKGLVEGHGSWGMLDLRTAFRLEMFGKFPWYWEIIDGMNLPPLQIDSPHFALEQQMRYHRDAMGAPITNLSNQGSKRLAVLPFRNMSPEKDNEYFSDGITEEILNALARTPGLQVVARTSAFSFKGKDQSVQSIGEALKVDAVLDGSVRRVGSQLRITAQLVNVPDGAILWPGTFDRKAEDVFAIQTEVAQRVQEALKVQLLAAPGGREVSRGTDNLEAYELLLRGRQLWHQRTDIERAVAYCEQAIQKDPRYAQAYAGLAACYVILPNYAKIPYLEVLPKVRAAAQRAIELDPQSAEAHSVLADAYYEEGDFDRAERLFRQALVLNPNSATTHQWFAEMLIDAGRAEEGLVEIRAAQALDPLSPIIQLNVAKAMLFKRQLDEAQAQLATVRQLAPNFPMSFVTEGLVRMLQRDYLAAIPLLEQAQRAGATYNFRTSGYLGFCYGKAGRTSDALQVLNQLKASAAEGRAATHLVALVYQGLGDANEVFAWLDRAASNPLEGVHRLKFHPLWDEVTADLRYTTLLKQHGLEP